MSSWCAGSEWQWLSGSGRGCPAARAKVDTESPLLVDVVVVVVVVACAAAATAAGVVVAVVVFAAAAR